MSNYEAQAQLLWESVLDMMAPLCAKDDMTVLRSLALRAQSEKQWTLLAPNKFACEQIKKSLFVTLDMALRNKGIKEVKLEMKPSPPPSASPAGISSPTATRCSSTAVPASANRT